MTSWITRLRAARVVGAYPLDLGLAVILAAFGFMDTVLTREFGWLDQWRGPSSVNGVVIPAIALLLAWRRRFPLAVLAVSFAALDALGLGYGSTQSTITVFVSAIAVYSAVAYGSSVPLAIAVTTAGLWLRDHYDPLIRTFGDHLWSWMFLTIFVAVGYATRLRNRRLARVEDEARANAIASAARIEAAADEERRRIARELHDIVAHSLGLLVFQAGVGEQMLDADVDGTGVDRAREAFRSIRVAGLEAVGEMATILGLIRGDGPAGREPQPTAGDIESLVRKARDTGVPVDFAVTGAPAALPAAVGLSLYRIAQEALTNAMKHAPSAPVQVGVRYHDDAVDVEVINGRGTPGTGPGAGRGLIGLSERVAIFGGRLDVGPAADGGWRLAASLPVAR